MRDDSRFFLYLWRFNGVLLAIAGVLGFGLVAFAVVSSLLRPSFEPQPEGRFAPVPKAAEQSFTYRLETGPAGPVSLGDERILDLRRWKGPPRNPYGLEDSSGLIETTIDYTNAVNLLAINTRHGGSHWLFRGYQRQVVSQDSLTGERPSGVSSEQPAPTIALVIRTVDADTNKDGALNAEDRKSLYYYRPGGGVAVKFLDADYIIATQQTSASSYLVVYENGAVATAARFSLPDFKFLGEQKLPNVP